MQRTRQIWGTQNLFEVWIQNHHESRASIWRAVCVRCGKPQISPLRFAPVEMTKVGGVAGCRLCNSMPHFYPPGLTLLFFLSFPKGICFRYSGRSEYRRKTQISPLRFALSKIILGGLLRQLLWSPTLATRGWGTLNLFEVWIQNHHESRVPHMWCAVCARCGKPQISPLRFAPVEMTKVGGVAGCRLCNPMPHFCPPGLTLLFFLSFPKGICFRYSGRSEYRRKTADLSAALRSGRDDKGRWSGWM